MRYVVIGGGIVGLATAYQLVDTRPGAEVTVVEKEPRWAGHQTGHNSGVIHAGVYYRPGSLKAKLCDTGRTAMLEFCAEHDVPVRVCGKLIVATSESELPRLAALHERALANGVPARRITPAEAREIEPAVSCLAAVRVESTGIVDFARVCERLADLLAERGAQLRLATRVIGLAPTTVTGGGEAVAIQTTGGDLIADAVVNCAGLQADRIARMAGAHPGVRIVPFRGEYGELREQRRNLVRGLIYPVPDPGLPFLGVHLTRMIDGGVHAGPNAVLALAREGYSWGRVRPGDVLDAVTYPGLWRLARRHLRYGADEVLRSLSHRRFARSVARLVPEITAGDLVPSGAGVRAQAITREGFPVDDFLLIDHGRQVHVLNAPSPAATSSLAIGRQIAARLPT